MQQRSEAVDDGAKGSGMPGLPSVFAPPACLGAPMWQALHRPSIALERLTCSGGHHGCTKHSNMPMSAGQLTCTACDDLHNQHMMTGIILPMYIYVQALQSIRPERWTALQVLDFELQRQLVPYMKEMTPLPGIYDPDFIAANQDTRADNVIKGSRREQLETIRQDIRSFKQQNQVRCSVRATTWCCHQTEAGFRRALSSLSTWGGLTGRPLCGLNHRDCASTTSIMGGV